MNGTTISISNYQTYTLGAPLTNGTSIEFLESLGTTNGVLILNDNSAASAFTTTTTSTSGTLHAYTTVGGSVLHFGPAPYGGIGNQISIQVISNLFDALDVAATASTDNASFGTMIAAKPIFLIEGGSIHDTSPYNITLNANESHIVDEILVGILGTAATAAAQTLQLSFDTRLNPNSNSVFVDGVLTTYTMVNPCFAAGTRIMTVRGEIPVEQLAVGDLVITASGAERTIIWTGAREVVFAAHPRPLTVRPVIIEAGAIAEGVPRRTLTVSPDHALWLDEMLVPAKALLNWTSVRQDLRAARVTYHHFELSGHDIIFAEGCPAESFLDTGHKGVFGPDGVTMHPTAMQQRREAESCAPLCESGPKLAAIRARLALRRGRNDLMDGTESV